MEAIAGVFNKVLWVFNVLIIEKEKIFSLGRSYDYDNDYNYDNDCDYDDDEDAKTQKLL